MSRIYYRGATAAVVCYDITNQQSFDRVRYVDPPIFRLVQLVPCGSLPSSIVDLPSQCLYSRFLSHSRARDAASYRFWVDELQKHEERCRIYLCGTKFDVVEENRRKRQVDFHAVTDFAETLANEARVFETSARTGHRVNELFDEVARDYVRAKKDARVSVDSESSSETRANLGPITIVPPSKKSCQCG